MDKNLQKKSSFYKTHMVFLIKDDSKCFLKRKNIIFATPLRKKY